MVISSQVTKVQLSKMDVISLKNRGIALDKYGNCNCLIVLTIKNGGKRFSSGNRFFQIEIICRFVDWVFQKKIGPKEI